MDERMGGPVGGWMGGWMDGWMGGWVRDGSVSPWMSARDEIRGHAVQSRCGGGGLDQATAVELDLPLERGGRPHGPDWQ